MTKLCLSLVFLILVQIHADEDCVTPNNEKAKCISLYACPILLQALVTQKQQALDFVRQSHCGTWSRETQPFVCCGSKSDFEESERPKRISITSPPGITNTSISDKRFCGYQHTDDYFYDGNITAIDEFPWLAVFKYRLDPDLDEDVEEDFYEFGCAGSLINDRYVLTAAQCLRLRTSSAIAVRLGEYNIKHEQDCVKFSEIDECSNPVQDVGIEKKIKHPKYDRRHGLNDIALVRLNRKITYSDYIRPICLPNSQTRFAKIGDVMVLTGFGRTGTFNSYAIIKKKILAKLITNKQCDKEFSTLQQDYRKVNDNIMCTKEVSANQDRSCEGDSGGPLMFSHRTQWHIEGIAVWSTDICEITYPFAYTKVINYIEWIEKTVVP